MDTSPDGHGDDVLSRQRLGYLHAELRRIETYLGGMSVLQGRDPTAILATVTSEITQLRQIIADYVCDSDRDA